MSTYEKAHSDDEHVVEKIALRSKVLFPKPDTTFTKKSAGGTLTAPKPPHNMISIKPAKFSDSSSILKKNNRQVNADKEKLYEENLELKQKNNSLNDENLKLKTKLLQLEKELSRKDELSEPGKNSSHLLLNLKQIVKELKHQLNEKNIELETCRKNLKSSKVQELETEVKVFSDECTRLRHYLSEILKAQGSSIEVSSQALEKNIASSIANEALKKENFELAGKIEELNQEKESLSSKLLEKSKVKKRNEIMPKAEVTKLRSLVDKTSKEKNEIELNKNQEINEMKKVVLGYQAKLKSTEKTIEKLKLKIENLENESNQFRAASENAETGFQNVHKAIKTRKNPPKLLNILSSIVKSKNITIADLFKYIDKDNLGRLEIGEFVKRMKIFYPSISRKYVDCVARMIENLNGSVRKNEIALNDLKEFYELFDDDELQILSDTSDEKDNIENNEAKVRFSENLVGKAEKALDTQASSNTMESENLVFTNIQDSPRNRTIEQTHSITKPPASLEHSIQHIILRLQLNRIPEKSLYSIIFQGAASNSLLNSKDIKNIFQHPPFNLTDSENLEDLVRAFPSSPTAGQFIVNLADLLPNWEILSEAEERVLDQELNRIISSNYDLLFKACTLVDKNKQNFLTVNEFFSVFRILSIELDEKMKNYVKLLLYSYDLKIDLADYNHFLQVYRTIQLSYEERAVVVRTYLIKIADVLRRNRISAMDVFCTNDENIITEDYFYEGLERLGIFNLPKEHIDVIFEALQCNAGEIGISLFEFNDILGHYGVLQNQTILEESRSLYSSFESEKPKLSQMDESDDNEYSNEYEEEVVKE